MGVTLRPQVGALPLRFEDDGTLKVLLITSRRSRKWIIPKGNLMKSLAPHDAAAREAFEEAGAIGSIEGCPRGCRVAVYVMAVEKRVSASRSKRNAQSAGSRLPTPETSSGTGG